MTAWYDDDEILAGVVHTGLIRENAPPPAIPGCEQLEEIGRGGQGIVYRAVQTATRREVAVKLLLEAPGRNRSARLRFEREIEIVAALRDARLVQVFAGGETDDGRPFVVMELVDGVRIDRAPVVAEARASGFARPAADAVIALFAEVCAGMDHAHRHGVIHRDLKPSNVFVDRSGTPRILDFGLAKSSVPGADGSSFVSAAGGFLGSLPWTSPEQAEGRAESVDVRSDVYALGATLYDVVAGRPPVAPDLDLRRALDAVVKDAPPSPSSLDGRCDRDLEAVILRALEKDPERRYATAGDLCRDLRRLLAGEPIEARRETAWRALVKLARRRRRVAILCAVLAIAAIAVFIVTSWLWHRAEAESERALAESRRAEGALDFFLDSIGMVDPARDGANTRLTDALDRISSELDRRFGDDLTTRLKFRMRLRDLYIRLGRFDRGLAEAEAVSVLTRTHAAPAPSAGFRSGWNGETVRAFALYRTGRPDEALAIYREVHAALAAAFGDRDHDALTALASAAQVLKARGSHREAEETLRRVVRATEGAVSIDDGALARAMALDNLAALAEIGGRPADAEAPQREAVRLFAATKGEAAPETLMARSNLGNLLLTLDRPKDAVEILLPTVTAFRERSGGKSPTTLAASHNLGVALVRAGATADGERALKEVYETRLLLLGAAAHDTLLTLNELAVAAAARGDADENERLLKLLVEGRKSVSETPPVSYWNAVTNLAGALRDRGRLDAAIALYEEVLPAARSGLERDHWLVGWIQGNYGRCLADAGRHDAAAVQLSESVAILSSRLGPGHGHTVAMRASLERNQRRRAAPETRTSSRPSALDEPLRR